MLREIYCEKFHQKRIRLKQGLNVVLGTNTGDNSIGKSTFLLIIDFVLGGSTYANSNDILNNIKEHDIFFSFFGRNEPYYFARNNINSNIIWVCDQDYNKIRQIDIEEYKEWLNNYYQLQLSSLSFRDAVGRYIRVYGKENYNENEKNRCKKASHSAKREWRYFFCRLLRGKGKAPYHSRKKQKHRREIFFQNFHKKLRKIIREYFSTSGAVCQARLMRLGRRHRIFRHRIFG